MMLTSRHLSSVKKPEKEIGKIQKMVFLFSLLSLSLNEGELYGQVLYHQSMCLLYALGKKE